MKVFREYRSKLLAASDINPNYAPVRNLTYSQAVILIGVPEEGREQFIIDLDIEGMTNQELQKAFNERTQAQHVLSLNFVKIRHYGILSNRNRKTKLKKSQNIFGVNRDETPLKSNSYHGKRCFFRSKA